MTTNRWLVDRVDPFRAFHQQSHEIEDAQEITQEAQKHRVMNQQTKTVGDDIEGLFNLIGP